MDIWRWILVIFPVIKLTHGVMTEKKENGTINWTGVFASFFVFFAHEFLLYMADVLIIE